MTVGTTENSQQFSKEVEFDLSIERVYTPEEACMVLRHGLNVVYGLIKSRQLKAKKVGRKYLITTSAIKEFLGL